MSEPFMEVFTVIESDDPTQKDFWLKIGRCFPHKNGDGGFNILLNALPLDNKLIVKPRKPRVLTEDEEDSVDEG